jgi:cytoskeleton protein RodZ
MNVSTREVADALNLPSHVIEALESDDYERLPPSVFTRGYLRSYARLLELAPDPLLARYPEVTEEVDAITGEIPTTSVVPEDRSFLTLAMAAVAAILFIVFLVWWFSDDEAPEGSVTSEPEAPVEDRIDDADSGEAEIEDMPEPAPVPSTLPAGRNELTAPVPEPVTVLPDDADQSNARATEPVEQTDEPTSGAAFESEPVGEAEVTAAVSTPAVPAGGRRERRITEFGDDQITFAFGEDCWVEVKTVDGENLYSDLNRAGQTLVLTGRAPFRILLGYAPGVSLEFNGESVPLERHSRNNVASLVLGED